MFEKNRMSLFIRVFSYSILATTFVFSINNVLTVWFVFGRTDAVEFIIVEIEKQMMNIQEWNILSLF